MINGKPEGMISISWIGGKGLLRWGLEMPQFMYVVDNNIQYWHFHIVGVNPVPSTGTLDVTKYGKVGDNIVGSFVLGKAGTYFTTPTQNQLKPTVRIEGFLM